MIIIVLLTSLIQGTEVLTMHRHIQVVLIAEDLVQCHETGALGYGRWRNRECHRVEENVGIMTQLLR